MHNKIGNEKLSLVFFMVIKYVELISFINKNSMINISGSGNQNIRKLDRLMSSLYMEARLN